ncbi:protein kinase [Stackebrandtia nassauensis]|uniref:non-specific serine/threonine protein kinase n=1 Tax=Stackebrandtia nassauensis (strain DSM 44728 / CIP 108903 / NRRL B-16338 / NBRC 102104 / LLR-40K-21) TaxID=446470 RepID=D3PWF3_STANL|nr:protein kinase [Stackebrandtia nassauensis]ADD41310.1 serine/threonine protein kinase [Stackebrandtia nassauensis DSM 44728]
MPAVSTAGAVKLTRLLHRDAAAGVYTGTLGEARTPVVVTLAHQRVDGSAREVFLDWGSKLTHLSAHPHIAPVSAVGLTQDACPYIAVRATRATLADNLREAGPPPAGQVRAFGVALADTLATIHGTGLIHGALQPATILSSTGRKLLVAGFDATAPVLAHCLPPSAYTAPEHLDAAKAGSMHASPAADVHNLATLLYASLGGRLPWVTVSGKDTTDPLLRAAPIPDIPGVSIALTDVLGAAMNVDPRKRPSAAGLRDLLANVDTSRPLAAGRQPTTVCPALVPRSGPRPAPLPGGADIAVQSKRRSPRRFRLPRSVKVVVAFTAAFLATAGAGLATFAVTHADPAEPCPSDSVLTDAVTEVYGESSITDKLCGQDGYVAVTAKVAKESKSPESRAADSVVEYVALRMSDGVWTVIGDPCSSDTIPETIRDYVKC